jgi:biotin-dependent carboxylase-like uncharacterized protein
MEITVVQPGLLTTIQDLGRPGWRRLGITAGGAMDTLSLRLANLLVGNPEDSPALEVTLRGPTLKFDGSALVSICGGDFEIRVDGHSQSASRPFVVFPGETLSVGTARRGCRAYLAVAGGLRVEACLGGRGTDLRAGFGGVDGRALRAGDVLTGSAIKTPTVPDGWFVSDDWRADLSGRVSLRALRGEHAGEFATTVFDHEFEVSSHSDRMGLRLQGPALARARGVELLSTAVMPGTIQIPPDGQPIVLAADCQTIGGYPRAAHVITADLPSLGQLRPGDQVRFVELDLAAAHAALAE